MQDAEHTCSEGVSISYSVTVIIERICLWQDVSTLTRASGEFFLQLNFLNKSARLLVFGVRFLYTVWSGSNPVRNVDYDRLLLANDLGLYHILTHQKSGDDSGWGWRLIPGWLLS